MVKPGAIGVPAPARQCAVNISGLVSPTGVLFDNRSKRST
jgi:hypothetical protein